MEQSSLHQSPQFSDNGAPERAPSIKEKIDQKKKKKSRTKVQEPSEYFSNNVANSEV